MFLLQKGANFIQHFVSPRPRVMKKNIVILAKAITLTGLLRAQTGPGGVGSTATTAMWLAADGGVYTNAGTTQATQNQAVQQWNDLSGNNRHATQTTAANRPLFRNNVANNKPGLRFTGNMFIDGPSPGIASTSDYTYLLAFRDTATSVGAMGDGNGCFILDRPSATNELVSLKQATGNFYGYQKRNNAGGGLGGPLSTTAINTNFKLIQMRRDYNVNYQIFYNGVQQATLADGDGATSPPEPRIGRHATTANGGIRGYICEFIIYGFALNSAQTIIVNNYLAAKYGITLGGSDIYVQDNAANGNYDHEVAGIGRVDASNIHSDAKGTGMVRILNPGGLNNNEFFIWGHNGGVAQATNTTDVPSGVNARLDRVWRVSEVNASGGAIDVGSIDMRWDLNALGAITATDVVLLVDTDGDGSFTDETPITGPTSLGGGIYQFSGVTSITNGDRFTLGTLNSMQTPLPVELLSFYATVLDQSQVELSWKTAIEIRNDYFSIERSKNAETWETIGKVKGSGTIFYPRQYQWVDEHPFEGTSYYRLKQNDANGEFKYLGIKQVSVFKTGLFAVYPVPAEETLIVKGKGLRWALLKIRCAEGQDVSESVRFVSEDQNEITLDVRDLPPGVYLISSGEDILKFVKK